MNNFWHRRKLSISQNPSSEISVIYVLKQILTSFYCIEQYCDSNSTVLKQISESGFPSHTIIIVVVVIVILCDNSTLVRLFFECLCVVNNFLTYT